MFTLKLTQGQFESSAKQAEAGVVYTKPWVVEVILDLAGYTPDKPLGRLTAIEPSAGDGAFLVGMARRLVESCKRHKISFNEIENALQAYEISPQAAVSAVESLRAELISLGVAPKDAIHLARQWVRNEDFLEASTRTDSADFVIGNPPYIRLEEIPEPKADLYRNAYGTMRGRADIYVAFFQAALTQLKPKGVCAFICSDRWIRNDYGRSLRNFISSKFSVRYILETHDIDAFENEVSAYPSITIIAREQQGNVVVAKALPGIEKQTNDYIVSHLRSASSNSVLRAAKFDDWFHGDEPWSCQDPAALALLREFEARFLPLESNQTKTTVGIGVATGADAVFLTRGRINIEEGRLLPLATSLDINKPDVDWSGNYLVNPWDKDGLVDLDDYPLLGQYLTPFRHRLQSRHTAKNRPDAWHRTIDRVNLELLGTKKLYVADIKHRLLPSFDNGKTYPHHNLYWITSDSWDLRALGALLMSQVGEFFISCYGVKMRGGYFRFQAQYLRRIRVPHPDTIPAKVIEKLARAFNSRDFTLATSLALDIYGIKTLPAAHCADPAFQAGDPTLLDYAQETANKAKRGRGNC